ncbi:MBL fold metallo-hydrolase [Anaerobacillus sp. MEB173]|uniref:MBL fold metallo-hydrolase n=1 Tax=Anaerobacillus sp. MEB173 TaxID=3383345 RepID=UPI003F912209
MTKSSDDLQVIKDVITIQMIERDGYTVYPICVEAEHGLRTYNFYLIRHGKSLTLIDAGAPVDSCWNELMKTLEGNGFSLTDVSEILLTHHHIDHVGLVNRITEKHPIPVYAHPNSIPRVKRDADFLTMRIDFFDQLYRQMDCGKEGQKHVHYLRTMQKKNDHLKLDPDIISLKGGMSIFDFQVFELPGHAPDQIAFVDEKRKWAFAGDHLIEHISSNAIVEPDHSGQRMHTLSDYKSSLLSFLNLNMDLVFSGHGDIIENPNKLIEMRLARIEEKSQKIKDLIEKGISTGSEVAKTLYQHRYQNQFSLVMSEIIGHLDVLEERHDIEKKVKNNVWYYSVV